MIPERSNRPSKLTLDGEVCDFGVGKFEEVDMTPGDGTEEVVEPDSALEWLCGCNNKLG